jgi:hypothetical protein
MNQEELMAKYQPRQLENQVEFETIMSEMNNEQSLLNHPYIDRKMEIIKKRELLMIQLNSVKSQLSALSAEYQDIEIKMKEINRAYHAVKHEFIVLNPRERFIKQKEDNV